MVARMQSEITTLLPALEGLAFYEASLLYYQEITLDTIEFAKEVLGIDLPHGELLLKIEALNEKYGEGMWELFYNRKGIPTIRRLETDGCTETTDPLQCQL